MRLKQAINKNGQNWSIRKALSSITATLDHTYLEWLGKNWESVAGKFWCIHRIARTLPRPTAIGFGLWRTLLMVWSLKELQKASKEACENHLVQFFAQKSQKFYSDGIMILPEK